MLDKVDKKLLEEVAGLHEIPQGAYNIRKNGQGVQRNTTANIDIVTKKDKPGIDVIVKPGTKKESIHIPVILSQGMDDLVYNTFEIGRRQRCFNRRRLRRAQPRRQQSAARRHPRVLHPQGARMKYVEKHYGRATARESAS